MAEVVGLLSAGAGLVSLAIQLAESGRRIRNFYRSFQDAPKFLAEIADDLDTFVHALRVLESDRQSRNTVDPQTVEKCVLACRRASDQVREAVEKLETIMRKSKTMGRARIALAKPEIRQQCTELERAKASLQFAYMIYTESRRKADSVRILQELANNSLELSQHNSTFAGYESSLEQVKATLFEIRGATTQSAVSRPEQECRGSTKQHTLQSSLILHRRRTLCRRRTWRLRLNPWFTSRVWDLSLQVAQRGWNLNLQAFCLVPYDALIFDACQDGNLTEVQMLFCQGRASPFDYSDIFWPGLQPKTVLTAAASSGNVELCRYLIDLAGYQAMPENARDPLDVYVFEGHCNELNSPEMYRLIVRLPGWDIDKLLEPDSFCWWWSTCPNVQCLRVLKDEFPWTFRGLSFDRRFDLALAALYFYSERMPEIFLEMLDWKTVDSRIARAQNDRGRTVLHVLGPLLRSAVPAYLPAKWVDFLKQVVHSGADLHHQNDEGHTPLMDILACSNGAGLRGWIQLLEMASVDLHSYGKTEIRAWNASRSGRLSFWCHSQLFDGLVYGPDPDDWTVQVYRQYRTEIPLYEAYPPPGAWPEFDERIPLTICWQPGEEDILANGWRWRKRGSQLVSSGLKLISQSVDIEDHEIITQVHLQGSQDDCGAATRLVRKASQSQPARQRSSSAPPEARDLWDVSIMETVQAHKCIFDGRIKPGHGDMGGRHCAKGMHDFDYFLWDHLEYIDWDMRRFRERHPNFSQLHRLPYSAYHIK